MRAHMLVCLLSAAAAAQPNLVSNPGFEEGLKGWNVSVSGGGRDMIRGEIVSECHSGKQAAKVTMLTDAHVGILNSAWFAVEPDQRYDVSLWSRVESVANNPRPRLRILIRNTDGTHPVKDYGSFGVRASEKWQEHRYWYISPPDAARVYLTFFLHFPGTLYLDDVVMRARPVSDEGASEVITREGLRFFRLPEDRAGEGPPVQPSAEDKRRGFVPFVRDNPRDTYPDSIPRPEETGCPMRIAALPGTTTSGWFSLYALRDLADMRAEFVSFAHAEREGLSLAECAALFAIKAWPQRTGGWRSRFYSVVPELLAEPRVAELPAGEVASFFLRLAVPASAPPGQYRGNVAVFVGEQRVAHVPVEVKVLPVKLPPPRHRWMLYFGSRVPLHTLSDDQVELMVRDIHAHDINALWISIHHLGMLGSVKLCWEGAEVKAVEWPKLVLIQKLRRELGMRGPLIIGASPALPYDHVARHFGLTGVYPKPLPTDRADLNQGMVSAIRALDALIRETGGPEYSEWYYEGPDEPGSHPHRQTAHLWEMQLAKRAGVKTYVTAYGAYAEKSAPHVDIQCFSSGWALDSAEDDRKCREQTKRFGNTHWFYGAGCYTGQEGGLMPNRWLTGALLFKSGASGVGCWTYQGAKDDPWDDFDGNRYGEAKDAMITYPGPNGPVSTLQWEGIREGILDCRLLEAAQDRVREDGCPRELRDEFEALVESIPWLGDKKNAWDNAACARLRTTCLRIIADGE